MSHKNQSMQWACQLTASPARAIKDDDVFLTVILSHQKFGEFNPDDHPNFYKSLFFTFDANHPKLKSLVAVKNGVNKTNVDFFMPLIADGSYGITVTVTKVVIATTDPVELEALATFPDDKSGILGSATITVANHYAETRADVSLQRSSSFPTSDEGLWVAIRNRSAAIEFDRYKKFIDTIFSANPPISPQLKAFQSSVRNSSIISSLNIYGPYAYNLLKLAAQAFLVMESGVVIQESDYNKTYALLSPNVLEKERIRLGEPIVSALQDLRGSVIIL